MSKKTGRTFREVVLRHTPYHKKLSATATATASGLSSDKEQIVLLTIARMNPPTPGHMKLIKNLIDEAGKKKVYILLQAGEKAGKEKQNPLTCSEKKRYLLEMIGSLGPSGKNVVVVCADDELDMDCKQDSDPLRQICDIYKREKYNPEKKTTFYLWVGTERVESFKKFLGNVDYLPPNSELVTKELVRAIGGISGTKLRELAMNDKEEDFIKLEMEAGLSHASANELYDILNERMKSLPPIYKKPSAKSASAAKSAKGTKKGGKRKRYNKTKRRAKKKINRNKK